MKYFDYNANNNNNNYLYSIPIPISSDVSPKITSSNQWKKKWKKELLDLSLEKWKLWKLSIGIVLILSILLFSFLFFNIQYHSSSSTFDSFQRDNRIESKKWNINSLEEIKLNRKQSDEWKKRISNQIENEKIKLSLKKQSIQLNNRKDAVRDAMKHALNGYFEHAFGFDEIRPVTNETNSSWGGFGITLFDSLDTMLLMNLEKEYIKSIEHVLKVDFKKDYDASFFESSIRYLGGLLGAFQLSDDKRLLIKAKEIGDALLPAFNTPSGIPYSIINLKTGEGKNPSWTQGNSLLAEVGSIQLEFKYLSHHTGDPKYKEVAHKVMEILFNNQKSEGLYPTYINPETGEFENHLVSYGGLGDSFYEYLLKQYILTGKKDSNMLNKYNEALKGLKEKLISRTNDMLTFVGEYDLSTNSLIREMDHLACYVAGMVALGADGGQKNELLRLAEDITLTCVKMYEDQPTGLGPERVSFSEIGYSVSNPKYILRPETIESIFVLFRKTGDKKWREIGWNIFLSIEKHCRTGSSFSGLIDVTKIGPDQKNWNNSMQSFFLAETLKYLFLLFSDPNVLPLDQYVFTTEAHPLGILK